MTVTTIPSLPTVSSVQPVRRLVMRAALVTLALTCLVACADESPGEACARGPLFSSARQRAERAVSELDRTTTIELEESVTAVVDQLLLLREISPRDLRDALGVLLAAYGQLVVALDDAAWNPEVANNDPAVSTARAAFAETSVAQAVEEVTQFYAQQCELALGESNPLFAITGTTLPLPESGDEASLDAPEDAGASASELQAVGFLIGETYGVALVAPEAECVARSLGATFADASDINVNDEQYFALVVETFVSCGVTTPPTTTPEN